MSVICPSIQRAQGRPLGTLAVPSLDSRYRRAHVPRTRCRWATDHRALGGTVTEGDITGTDAVERHDERSSNVAPALRDFHFPA